jgi:hypothetical protein
MESFKIAGFARLRGSWHNHARRSQSATGDITWKSC